MAKLVVISQSVAGSEYELGESWVTIGRSEGNLFQIPEASVSGRHCEVKVRGAELLIHDLGSTNGSFVSGQKVIEAAVPLGQTFRLGNVEVRFEGAAKAIPKVSLVTPAAVTPVARVLPVTPTAIPKAVLPLPPKPTDVMAAAPGKFQVLFVDDSLAFHDSFARLCGELSGGRWQIHTATAADRALVMLAETHIDLAVLDIGMPMLDGIQLLSIVRRRYPNLKIAVMTGLASEANRSTCLANGAELFLEKPLSIDGIKLAFNMLNDILVWTQQKGFSGTLQQVGLPDVIQMECLNGKSVILEVRNANMFGQIFIESGKIIHAATGNLTGEKAFQELLLLSGGQFQLQPFHIPSERTVSGHWEFLLMEASRVRDEKSPAGLAEAAAAAAAVPTALVAPIVAPAPMVPVVAPIPVAAVVPPPPVPVVSAPVNGKGGLNGKLNGSVAVPPPMPITPALPPVPDSLPEGLPPENPNSRFVVRGEDIVVIDGDEEDWLMVGGSKTNIQPPDQH
jgi:CheY-like chemotaxis protein